MCHNQWQRQKHSKSSTSVRAGESISDSNTRGRHKSMRYEEKGKRQNRRKCYIFTGICGISMLLAVICLINLSRLRRDLQELVRQLNGGKGEISVTGAAQNANSAPEGRIVGTLPENDKKQGSSGQPADADRRGSTGRQGNAGVQDAADTGESYPDQCALEYVESPEKRKPREVLARLRELGEDNGLIADIAERRGDFPDKLLEALANNPEMADFVSRWEGPQRTAAGGLTDGEKEQDFPLFLQWDPRWGYVEYGDGSCIGLSGCGPTCLSMALYYLMGDESITPDRVGKYSMENGCYISGVGTAWTLMEEMPLEYGIQVRQPKASERELKAALDDGAVIILSMGPGYFTAAGHFIVVYGYDEDGFLVNDPNCVARSRMQWSYAELEGQIKNTWVFSKGNQPVYYYGDADMVEIAG